MRWINARASLDRSEEELAILAVEMGTVHRSYRGLAKVWEERALRMEKLETKPVHAILAWEKEEIWSEYANRARHEFNALIPGVI